MKPRTLAEQQTVSLTRVHPRIEVRHREYEPGKFTNDIEVDGRVWTVVLRSELLEKFLPAIKRQVDQRPTMTHVGYGTWEIKPGWCRNKNAAQHLYEALKNLIADWERVTGRTIPDDHEAKAALALAEGKN